MVASEAQASTPRKAVSMTDDGSSQKASSGDSGEEPVSMASIDSNQAYNDDGVLVNVEPASPSDVPRDPPVPVPVEISRSSSGSQGDPELNVHTW